MATPPTFTTGAVLTAAQMSQVGLWKIATSSFTSQTTVPIDNVFSADYDDYEILIDITASATNGNIGMQLNIAGTPTATNYTTVRIENHSNNTTPSGTLNTLGTDEWTLFPNGSTTPNNASGKFTIISPNLASYTKIVGVTNGSFSNNALYLIIVSGSQASSSQFTGFDIIFPGSTSGRVSVYGYRD